METTLQQIKEALHTLPMLASPIPGEALQLYLSTSNEAIFFGTGGRKGREASAGLFR